MEVPHDAAGFASHGGEERNRGMDRRMVQPDAVALNSGVPQP